MSTLGRCSKLIGSLNKALLSVFLLLLTLTITTGSQALVNAKSEHPSQAANSKNEISIFLPTVLNKSSNLTLYALVGGGEDAAQEYDIAMMSFQKQSGISVVFEGSDDFENEVIQKAASFRELLIM